MATEINLFGDIGQDWWSGEGITEVAVLDALKELDVQAPQHKAVINSPGGNVDTGLAILTVIRQHIAQMKALNPEFQFETVCAGYAMSSASVIFMAGDIRTVALGGVVMIHDPWTCCYGNAQEMTKMAGVLDQLGTNCANIYATLCTPASKDSAVRDSSYFRTLMKDETYFIGDEAVNCGLATRQDIGSTASLCDALSPQKLKGRFAETMSKHYQRRIFTPAKSAQSVLNAKIAMQQMELLQASIS